MMEQVQVEILFRGLKKTLFPGPTHGAPVGRCGAPLPAAPCTHARCGRPTTRASARASARRTATRRSDPTRSSPSRSRGCSESELIAVVAACAHSRARLPQPTHAQHNRKPRAVNILGQQMAVAAAAPRAHPPRTTPRLPAARLFCSTGASRDTALEREASVTVVANTNEYL